MFVIGVLHITVNFTKLHLLVMQIDLITAGVVGISEILILPMPVRNGVRNGNYLSTLYFT